MVFKGSAVLKRSQYFARDNRKDALRESLDLVRPHTLQAPGYEKVNSFERLSP
jgi:hypothetical protein